MKVSKKIISTILASTMILGMTACNNTPANVGDSSKPGNSSSGGDFDTISVDSNASEGTPSSNGKVMKWLGYYKLTDQDKELVDEFNDNYGYTVEDISCTSLDYFETLAKSIQSGDSPDLVRYEWQSFPHGMSKNLYTPLDSYIDMESPTWKGMKEVAEDYVWNGKHYYIPYRINGGFMLFYSKTKLEESGITEDPYEMFKNDQWTWSEWQSLMKDWCDLKEENVGYRFGVTGMSILVSTGTKLIDVQGDKGAIVNNMKDANIQRAQEFMQQLNKDGLVDPEYQGPGDLGDALFTGFGLDWGYDTIARAMPDDEVYFVPFPRDEKADGYYTNSDTFGYLIPTNAKNAEASLKWMELNRLSVIDEENIASAKTLATEEHLYYPKCPECKKTNTDRTTSVCEFCGAERKENTNRAIWTSELYDLKLELENPESTKVKFIFDNCFGFSKDLTDIINGTEGSEVGIVSGPLQYGTSYTQIRDSLWGTVESYLDPYRQTMAS